MIRSAINESTARALRLGAAALLATVGLGSGASAQLTIVRVDQGGTPPPNLAGGGNLPDLFNAAADWWERVLCQPQHTVTIRYRWGSLSPGILGTHTLLSQGGSPNRETLGRITFDNDGSNAFYADPTPLSNAEYNTFAPASMNLGGGIINTGRMFRNSTGLATGRVDLFSVILHEVGHALGLSSQNMSYQAEIAGDNEIDVVAPRPLPGTKIPTTPGSAHLNVNRALMAPALSPSTRLVPAGVDVLTNAQLSQFTQALLAYPEEAASLVVNGSGVNPLGFVQTAPAVIGETWSATVDLSNGASKSIAFIGFGGPAQTSTKYGELLVAGPLMTISIAAGVHSSTLPHDCSVLGQVVRAQAATLGPPPIQLQNAIDIRVGSL